MLGRLWRLLKGRFMQQREPVLFSHDALQAVIARQREEERERLAEYERRQRQIDATLARLDAQRRVLRHYSGQAPQDHGK